MLSTGKAGREQKEPEQPKEQVERVITLYLHCTWRETAQQLRHYLTQPPSLTFGTAHARAGTVGPGLNVQFIRVVTASFLHGDVVAF
jgi:hypothetical protein